MAERVGFEPTCRLPDKTLSRRPRYDHFGTSPWTGMQPNGPFIIRSIRGRAELGRAAACGSDQPLLNLPTRLEELLHQLPAFILAHTGHHLEPMILTGQFMCPHR
jgi:hypothetical protein